MTNEQNNFPCRCGHSQEAHYDYDEVQGHWVWMDDTNEEVWQEEDYPRPVCHECGPYDCIFEQMNNLEYLEWKYEAGNK